MLKTNKKGFTLIELLVVIAIIGILASIVLASLNSARRKSRDSRRVADLGQIRLALELYFDSQRTYHTVAAPVNSSAGWTLGTLTTTGCGGAPCIAALPNDPIGSGSNVYTYASANADGSACTSGTCLSYVLKAVLEENNSSILGNDVDGTVATVDCADTATNFFYCIRP